jgi:hypothetical protein
MKTLMKLFMLLGKAVFGNLPFCSMPGAAVGSFVGFVLGIVMVKEPALAFAQHQLILIGLMLGFLGFLFVLILFGVWLHYGVQTIALPSFVNAILTGTLTAIVVNAVHHSTIAALLGALVGILVGALLCALCPWLEWAPKG